MAFLWQSIILENLERQQNCKLSSMYMFVTLDQPKEYDHKKFND